MEVSKWTAWRSNRSDTNEAETGIELKLCRTEEHHDAPGVSKFHHLSGLYLEPLQSNTVLYVVSPAIYCNASKQQFSTSILSYWPTTRRVINEDSLLKFVGTYWKHY
jgi:hypothetical protein